MIICAKCKKEMSCKRNGVTAVWLKHHCRIGDLYECKSCGAEILSANTTAFHNNQTNMIKEEYKIDMGE